MKEIVIDGKFLSQKVTGVQRYAREILRELSLKDDLKITVAMPKDAEAPCGDYPNCTFVKVGKFTDNVWEQWSLYRYCKKSKLPLLCMGNMMPVAYKNSLVVLHDVTFREKHKFCGKLWSWKYRVLVRSFVYKCRRIITVSDFSASRFLNFYPKFNRRPLVAPSGWEHVSRMQAEPVKNLPSEFYLAVSSTTENKNFRYIIELAKNNPGLTFIITGNIITGKKTGSLHDYIAQNNISNCIFTGYLTDEQLIWLYKHCKGFILPSFYEGFGLPPLEAIAAGCRNIYLSDIPVFHEIYGGVATFFDPEDYVNTVDLRQVSKATEENYQEVLARCSWKNSATVIYNELVGKND